MISVKKSNLPVTPTVMRLPAPPPPVASTQASGVPVLSTQEEEAVMGPGRAETERSLHPRDRRQVALSVVGLNAA